MAMNAQSHTAIGTSPWSVVFRQKRQINWLTAEESAAQEGVRDEEGNLITEESLSLELARETNEEVLSNFRGISDLAIRVPPLTPAALVSNEPLSQIPPPTPRSERVVPIPQLPSQEPIQEKFTTLAKGKGKQTIADNNDDEDIVQVLAKTPPAHRATYLEGRTIAKAQLAPGVKFHNKPIPQDNLLLFFVALAETELIAPVPGGDLGYEDPDEEASNLAGLYEGSLFYWPSHLVSKSEIDNTQSELEAQVQSDIQAQAEESGSSDDEEDVVLKRVRVATEKARQNMSARYSKNHNIEVFIPGDIITFTLPKGTRTAIDLRRCFGRILEVPHAHRHSVQTVHGIVDRLFPTKELNRVPKITADGMQIQGPNSKLALSKVAELESQSERVIISCNCKGACNNKRCRCFKHEQRCSVHCHTEERDCGFMSELSVRTEMGVGGKKDKTKPKPKPKRKPSSVKGVPLQKRQRIVDGDYEG